MAEIEGISVTDGADEGTKFEDGDVEVGGAVEGLEEPVGIYEGPLEVVGACVGSNCMQSPNVIA